MENFEDPRKGSVEQGDHDEKGHPRERFENTDGTFSFESKEEHAARMQEELEIRD